MFVIRMTSSPAADLARGWSAWHGIYEAHPESLPDVENWMLGAGIDELPDDPAEAADFVNDESPLYVRRCPATGMYGAWHHDGLSAYELTAGTLEDAIAEAKAQIDRHTFRTGGCTAIEPIAYHAIAEDIYVFECREIGAQHDS